MASFDELLQDYVNKSYDEILAFANYSMADLSAELNDMLDGESISKAYMIITAACIGVDGKFSTLEYTFLKDLLELDMGYDDVKEIIQTFCGTDAEEFTDKLADSLSSKGKAALLTFCLSFLSVDETISRDEVAFVRKLAE